MTIDYKKIDIYHIDENDNKKWGLTHGLANNPITHLITDNIIKNLLPKLVKDHLGSSLSKHIVE